MQSDARVLILGAMDEEIDTLLLAITPEKKEKWNGFHLYFGTLQGRKVVVCKSGIGKVFSSIITQHILDRYSITYVLFTGVAGAVASDLEPGDIVLGERLIQHDFDVRALGFPLGRIPFTDYQYFKGDSTLLKKAQSARLHNTRVRTGVIGTGDQFITDKTGLKELELDCVDMEGCAVAQVCEINNVPSLIIRIISDKADGTANIDFAANLPRFSSQSLELIKSVLSA